MYTHTYIISLSLSLSLSLYIYIYIYKHTHPLIAGARAADSAAKQLCQRRSPRVSTPGGVSFFFR